jgi:hypothetical protein
MNDCMFWAGIRAATTSNVFKNDEWSALPCLNKGWLSFSNLGMSLSEILFQLPNLFNTFEALFSESIFFNTWFSKNSPTRVVLLNVSIRASV